MYTIVPEDTTVLSNEFLDIHMPKANGEFVKIYLCFLRLLGGSSTGKVPASDIADRLDMTEKDVTRALRYWESEDLLVFSDSMAYVPKAVSSPDGSVPESGEEDKEALPLTEKAAASCTDYYVDAGGPLLAEVPKHHSRERFEELEKKEEVRHLNFIAEQYFRRMLTRKDLETIAFVYDTLHFPYELVDYLLEYCADLGKTSSRYVLTVARRWHEGGIHTSEAAKLLEARYQKSQQQYFEILKFLGITGRLPIRKEKELMDLRLKDYGFSMEVIQEACERTILATSRPTLAYAGKILGTWHDAGVRTVADAKALDFDRQKSSRTARSFRSKSAVGNFGNYEQRNFDYRQTEKLLRGYNTEDPAGAALAPEPLGKGN